MSKFFEAKEKRERRFEVVSRQNEIGDKIKSECRCATPEEKDELVKLQAENVQLKQEIETAELIEDIESVKQQAAQDVSNAIRNVSMKSTGGMHRSTRDQEMALRAWALKAGGKSASITTAMRDSAHRLGVDMDASAFSLATSNGVLGDDASPENDQLMRSIEAVVKTYGEMLDAVDTIRTDNGNQMPVLIYDDTATLAASMPGPRADDLSTRAVTSDPISPVKKYLGAVNMDTGIFPVPVEYFQDYAFPLMSVLGEACGIRIGRKRNANLTNGRGVAQNEFNGIVPELTAASRVGTYSYTAGVTTGPEIYDILVANKFNVDRYYRNQPKSGYIFTDGTLGVLTSAKNTFGQPLFNITKDTISCGSLNEKYYINNDLAELDETTGVALIYGDPTAMIYRQVNNSELVILREVLRKDFNSFGVMMVERGDSLLKNPKALWGAINSTDTAYSFAGHFTKGEVIATKK